MPDIIQKSKNWFLTSGIILIVIGIAAIALPFATAIAVEVLLGWILIISSIVKIIHSFRALSTGKCILRLIGGILYLTAGVMLLVYPLAGVLTLTMLLAVLFLLEGIIQIAVALRIRPMPNWGWMLASGIAALVMAAIIWGGWPGTAAWAIGLLVGINLIFSGIAMLSLSVALGEH